MSQQVNLYQAQFREDALRFSAKTLLHSAAVAVFTLLAIAAFHGWQILQLQRQVVSLERQSALLKQQSADLAQKLTAGHADAALAEKVQKLESQLNSRQQLQAVLNDDLFSSGQGYSRYLVALARRHIAGLWLTDITLTGAGRDLTLRGETTEPDLVIRYLQNLSQETLLRGMGFHVFQLNRTADEPKSHKLDTFAFLVATSDTAGNQP